MFHIEVPQEIIEYARKLVAEFSFGRRGIADGSREQQITGLIGQIALADLFQVARPNGSTGPDGGVDFVYAGRSVDVKTMGRNVHPQPHHVNNFMALQKHFATDILLFCSFNKRTEILTVCGWIEKEEFLRRATLNPAGSLRTRSDGSTFRTKADLYEIQNQDLHSPRTPTLLKEGLFKLAPGEPSESSRLAA